MPPLRRILWSLSVFSRCATAFSFPKQSLWWKKQTFSVVKFLQPFKSTMSAFCEPSPYPKPVLAFDMDEVLARFAHSLARFHNDGYGSNFTEDSFNSYHFHEVWGGTVAECNVKMEEFFRSNHFIDELLPLPGAYEVLQRLKQDFSLHIVTARQAKLETITCNWLQRYYPNTFESIHFGNHYGAPGDRIRSKYEMCADINALCLFDDSPNYVFNCMRHNLRAFIFGDYAWNHNGNLPPSMLQEGYEVETFNEDALSSVRKNVEDKKIYRLTGWSQVETAVRHFFSSDSLTAEEEALRRAPKRDEFNVAIVQMTSVNDVEVNWHKIETLVAAAVSENGSSGLDLVCLPEAAMFLGETADETLEHAQPLETPLGVSGDTKTGVSLDMVSRLGALAKRHGVFLSVGGFPERLDAQTDAGGQHRMANTHLIFDRAGVLLSHRYRKLHLFDCPFVALYESRLTAPGDEVVSVTLDGWKIGLTVCYDLRFPALYEHLRHVHQCDAVLVPSAFTEKTGEAHWEVLLRARAIENQMYVVAAAQAGRHNAHRVSHGHSLCVDPWGSVVTPVKCISLTPDSRTAEDKVEDVKRKEHVQIVKLTKQFLRETHDKMPVQDHRRQNIY